jgi:hypothetical protein
MNEDKNILSQIYFCEGCGVRFEEKRRKNLSCVKGREFSDQLVRYCPVCQDVSEFKNMRTHQQKLVYGRQWRLKHGILPLGSRKGKSPKRRASKLKEMSFRRLGHEPITRKWIEAVNEILKGGD